MDLSCFATGLPTDYLTKENGVMPTLAKVLRELKVSRVSVLKTRCRLRLGGRRIAVFGSGEDSIW